jgi:hypothetical protein
MVLTPGLRRFALVVHVSTSLGWLGAVLAFLALAVTGLNSEDVAVVRGSYIAMGVVGWFVIVPLSVAALASGILQSLGTQWSFLQHYWVAAKLLINVAAGVLLLVHMNPTDRLAAVAVTSDLTRDELRSSRIQLVFDAAAAVGVLVVATGLSIYKPKGRIASVTGPATAEERAPGWVRASGYALVVMLAFVVLKHLVDGGMRGH